MGVISKSHLISRPALSPISEQAAPSWPETVCGILIKISLKPLNDTNKMKISVAICTWNRSRLLKQTLESIAATDRSSLGDWELIVVDNNSTDDTREVANAFSGQLPIVYETEKEQGHSASRNRAIEMATGELIIWTDNDVIVDANWLRAYQTAAQQYPDSAFFGGLIEPVFESPRPAWLEETWQKCKAVYAARDLGEKEFEFQPNQFPYGANFAVRAAVQKRFRFDTSVGRVRGGLVGEDEINLLRRITADGQVGTWVPNAKLQHFIPDDRVTPEYVRDYFIGQGIANVMNQKGTYASTNRARWADWHNHVCFLLKRKTKPPEEWVSHLICSSIARGECLQMKSGRKVRLKAKSEIDGGNGTA